MKDFNQMTEKDSMRLIVAQELKEVGIDLTQYLNNVDFSSKQQQSNVKNNGSSNSNLTMLTNQTNASLCTTTLPPNPFFGLHLAKLDTMSVNASEQTLSVPVFLKFAFDHLTQHVHMEGIFRRNGTATRLKELKRQAEEGNFNFQQANVCLLYTSPSP